MASKFRSLVFCFSLISTLTFAQNDAYDSYLNKNKAPRQEKQTPLNRNPGGDLKSRLMADVGASFHLFDAGQGRFLLPGVQFIFRADIFGNTETVSGSIGAFPMLGFQVDPWFGNFFMFNLPAMFEFNAGKGSYNFNKSWFGASLGLGPEYNYIATNGDFGLNQLGLSGSFTLRFSLLHRAYFIRVSESLWVPQTGMPFTSISFGNSFF